MPWVCSCGQRNIVNGLACLACERLPEDDLQTVETPVRPGFRFREDPVAETTEVEEPPAPGRRFRFTVSEPELTEVQSRDTGTSESAVGATSSTTSPGGFRFSPPVEDSSAGLDVPVDQELVEEPLFDESAYEDVAFAEQVYDEPVEVEDDPAQPVPGLEEHVLGAVVPESVEVGSSLTEAETPVPPAEESSPAWPEVDRRSQDRRQDDRRTFDSGVNPGELDDRIDTYLPDENQEGDDPWSTMRTVIGSALAPAAAPDPPAEEDPWEAFRRAREEYEAELAAVQNAPVDDFGADFLDDWQGPTPSIDDMPFVPEFDIESELDVEPSPVVEPIDHGEPVFAQPVEEFDVPAFEVDPYEVESIDDHDPILEEVMRHDPNALTEDDLGAFPSPWNSETDAEAPDGSQNYDHDWARWEQEQASPASSPQDPTTWANDEDGVWSAEAIADAHGDWSTVPQDWTADDTEWPVVAPAAHDDHEDDAWTAQDDPWTSAGEDPWELPATDDEWPSTPQQPVVDDDPWGATPQQPVEETWATDDDPWNAAPQQPAVDDDPWNASPQQPAVDDDPWNASPQQPAVDDDPWNAAPQQPAGVAEDEEQPWWAEQSGFGTQYEHDETNLPYFDGLDADEADDPYGFDDEPAYATKGPAPVSEYFDEAADLDEPDPFELEDDWTLPDESPRSGRSTRSLDREPQRGRSGRGGAKPSKRSAEGKKTPPRRKPSKQSAGGGFRLPFGSGSTLVTVIVIAIAIVALSLLFKDAFQRVGASTNPDGTTTELAASCADSPSASSADVDLAAATLAAVDNASLVPDHEAGTGTIDFTRALAAEPDASMALSVLDQSRFERGYDRLFNVKKSGTLHLSVYQFKGALCAQEYLKLHPVVENSLAVVDVAGSSGFVTQNGSKSFSGTVRGPVGDMVVVVEVAGVGTADVARAALQGVLTKQAVALRDAGVR
jgi:hypothetical protein